MSADASSTPEADFHSRLFVRLRDFISENPDIPFSEVSIEESVDGRRADIFVDSNRTGSLVIEVKRGSVNPRTRDVIVQARDYARDLDADFFATCNSNDFFLFDYRGEVDMADIDYYYLNLRSHPISEFVPVILQAVDHLYKEGKLPDQSRRQQLVGTLRSFHSSIWPAFRAAAEDAYDSNQNFIETFDDWVSKNNYQDRDQSKQFEIAAKQYAYLLMNRILFYEVVRQQSGSSESSKPITTKSGFPLEPLSRTSDERELDLHRIEDHLRDSFEQIITEVDYEPIFTTDSELFESFPHNQKTRQSVFHLIQNIESDPITEIDEDLLGEIYEELIPEDERKALGQFYTHPDIAETLVRWALKKDGENLGISEDDEIPRVLDPGSGSGTFVVEAYQHLSEEFPEASHQELVDHILAVDINRFPLHLTALNLASQRITEQTDHMHAYHASFFDLDPSTDFLLDTRIDVLRDGEDDGGEIGLVDAVVGNPPYIEASDLYPGKDHFRNHLRAFGPENSAPYRDGDKEIGSNADAYVYFITHATQFLREGGRLGFIIPTKWMMSRYGEQFQQFLYDHYKIEAVVGFNVRAFEDALIDTALVLLEKCSDEAARRENVVEFIQLHGTVTPENLLGTINYEYEIPNEGELTITKAENFRTVGIRQSHLEDEIKFGKIAHYLVAPEDLIELVESPELVPLGDMADVMRGAMTGSTTFFFPDRDDIETYGIEDEFLLPALKSMRGYDVISYDEEDINRWFIDIHHYVEDVRNRPDNLLADESLEEKVKSALEEDGYTGMLSWIRYAESEDEHQGATCQNREVWFDFGEPPQPEILFQKLLRERLFSIYNRVRAVPSNAVDSIDVHPDVDSKVLFGVLNSSIAQAIMEVWGRNEAGMLQLMTYETKSLPLPDVRSMTDAECEAIIDGVDAILERGASAISEKHRRQIDAAVLDTLDLDIETSVNRIQEIQQYMLNRRVQSGENIEVLIGEMEIFDETGTRSVSLQGKHDAGQGTLGNYDN